MATLKKRINISLSKDVEQMLKRLAKRDELPQATKAEHLLRLALEIEEDLAIERIVTERTKKNARYVSHQQIWK